jgi:hypothetical protein
MEDAQQVSCHCCPIDSLSVSERMWYSRSGKSLERKLLSDDLFDCWLRLLKMLRNNFCSRKRKLLKEIGGSLPQKVRMMTKSEFIFAWKIARLEADTPLFDLSQWISYGAEYDDQFFVNYLGAKAFWGKRIWRRIFAPIFPSGEMTQG